MLPLPTESFQSRPETEGDHGCVWMWHYLPNGTNPESSRALQATAEHSSLSVNQLTFLPPPTIYLKGAATKSADLRGRKGDRQTFSRSKQEKERVSE